MSGLSIEEPPRRGSRPRPPVENCTIMPGQCFSMPSCTARSARDRRTGFRRRCAHGCAPASRRPRRPHASIRPARRAGPASRVVLLARNDPVMATAMTTGLMMTLRLSPSGVRIQLAVYRSSGKVRRAETKGSARLQLGLRPVKLPVIQPKEPQVKHVRHQGVSRSIAGRCSLKENVGRPPIVIVYYGPSCGTPLVGVKRSG